MAAIGKSNEKSDLLRSEGNQLYALRNFHDALARYNGSLCAAENESENSGLAYANRSAVYFELKLYELCLQNIDLALANKYPMKSREIMINRQNRCSSLMTTAASSSNGCNRIYEITDEKGIKFSGIAECLKLKVDQQFGRHIVAGKPLNVGDVIVNEKPLCKVLHEEFIYLRCGWCFSDNFMSLMPCAKCVKGKSVWSLQC